MALDSLIGCLASLFLLSLNLAYLLSSGLLMMWRCVSSSFNPIVPCAHGDRHEYLISDVEPKGAFVRAQVVLYICLHLVSRSFFPGMNDRYR